jgi:SAM-dependent methyltransferase
MQDAKPRAGPGPLVRLAGHIVNYAVARWPWTWTPLRTPTQRFFDSLAVGWDARVQASSEQYLAPLVAALDRVAAPPARILDIGTGTGAAALALAARYPDAEVIGIDVSAHMIAQAKAKTTGQATHVRFLVADIAHFDPDERFDLIAMLNMPPFFKRVVALLNPGGLVINASSYGPRTPFFTSPATLAKGFERHGLRTIAAERAGTGTFYLAQRPIA